VESGNHRLGRSGSGPLGGKWKSQVRKVGEWYVKSRHLKGCRPLQCRLKTDGLTPVSKY
jgi:hypothetical protein